MSSMESREPRRIGSTYRLQLNGIGFAGAAEAVPALAELGVETLYASPIAHAREGSTHGYDVVDPNVIDPGLGGRAGYDALIGTLGDHGMRLLIDIVPNHMAASVENRMFADVLRHGRRSRFAPVFDIAWEVADNNIVLPILDGPLASVLDSGRIRLHRQRGGAGYELGYDDVRLPLDPADDEDIAADLADTRDLKEPVARRQLELLLSHQHYRLVDWRSAAHAVNYRRFFDINDLIGIRQEDQEVFALTHQLVLDLAADERVAGFRVDHIDGLRDPAQYLARLRTALDEATAGSETRPVVVVEKILEPDEDLPVWPVDGTTGYEFAALVTGLFIESGGAARRAAVLAGATADTRSFVMRSIDAKRRVIDDLFPARLGHVSHRIARAVPHAAATRPNPADISMAVQELTSQLHVYRTYRRPGERLTVPDRRRLEEAAAAARSELTEREVIALGQVMSVLKGSIDWGSIGWEAVAAWQQLTPAVTAKGVEDTALYSSGTLLSAADVGADPDRPSVSIEDFHQRMNARLQTGRNGLSTLSTHDSKRSHDVRCRLAVLSEIPDRWESFVGALEARRAADQPDAGDRRYIYESIVGAWPATEPADEDFTRRIQDHVVKAAREAKRQTSWLRPDESYEAALQKFAADLLHDPESRAQVESMVADVEVPGVANSLAAVVLRATAPGTPDIYQSDDRWFLALVDPDNRRPLDVDALQRSLGSTSHGDGGTMLERWRDGAIKQAVIQATLGLRRAQPSLFSEGKYLPLTATGPAARHVVSFARVVGATTAIVVVPRLPATLAGAGRFPTGSEIWGDTALQLLSLAGGSLTDVLTGATISAQDPLLPVGDVLATLPVAVLVTAPEGA